MGDSDPRGHCDDDDQAQEKPRKPKKESIGFFVEPEPDAEPEKGRHEGQILEIGKNPDFRRKPSDYRQFQKEGDKTKDQDI
jgi:hypothetical protein